MSEYQYYEFRTIDRNLTAKEIDKLDDLSSRAEVTATGFTVTYNYGDFRGDPERLIEQYFDAFVYVANWGARRFMMRLPKRAIDLAALDDFANDAFSFWIKGEFVVLSFQYNDEGDGEWEEGESWMDELVPLRDELLNGDLRALYLGWLSGVAYDEEYSDDADGDAVEPPVPPGLKKLTEAQETLAAFLQMDEVLIEAAASSSANKAAAESQQAQLAQWLEGVPVTKKDSWLLELVGETGRSIRAEILLEFRESKSPDKIAMSDSPRRSVKELFVAREAHLEVYERRQAKKAADEKARKAKQAANKRKAELDALSKRVDAAWEELEKRLSTTSSRRFIQTVEDLTDLRELAARDGDLEAYRDRLQKLLNRHPDKPMLQSRVLKAMLSR